VVDVLEIHGERVMPGETRRIELPVARLPIHTMLHLPVTVVRGRRDGARLWLSAALHGDELNGMEIIRRILERLQPERMQGTLIAVPIVNVFGFILQSRYLPDRRDLNRAFPGSKRGSLASQLAHLFMDQVVSRCTHGIDLHTAAPPRNNLPQVRCNMKHPETRRCAEAFGAPVVLHGAGPKGTLRGAASSRGIPTLLYEAGESLRFDEQSIEIGVEGVLRVMGALEMLRRTDVPKRRASLYSERSSWVRAAQSGVLYMNTMLGARVRAHEPLAVITDPFGDAKVPVASPFDGVVVGQTNNALVHRGDGLLHVAALKRSESRTSR